MLTPKQAEFVNQFMVDMNATRAYLRAGYKCSEEAARRNAARLLTNADVASAITKLREKVASETGRTVAAVMADIGRVRDDAMQEVTDPETGSRAMLSHKDALKALELEGKHLGAFEDRIKLSGDVSIAWPVPMPKDKGRHG